MEEPQQQQPGLEESKSNFRIHVITWNVATSNPPDDINSLLHLNQILQQNPDLFVIGLQEVSSVPLRYMTQLVFNDPWSLLFMSTLGPQNYIKLSSIRMQGLLLLFFAKLHHVPFIRDIKTSYTRTGISRYWGNKGGVSVRFSFYGHMICLLNCHLAAHMEHMTERVDDFVYILDTQKFDCEKAQRIVDHKLVLWLGDLNFRIQDHELDYVHSCIDNKTYNLLWRKDQLTMMKEKELMLQEFEEGHLNFQPTYKFDLNSDTYDTSEKKRKPAWTDRILWRLKSKVLTDGEHNKNNISRSEEDEEYPLTIKQDLYTSHMEYSNSDHKPVVGTFTLELRKKDTIPLVHLQAEGEWSADKDALLLYTTLQPFPSSSWDWIGLYQVGFTSKDDYFTYTWVKDQEVGFSEEAIQVCVSKEGIPVRGGQCILCYYSSILQCIIGVSEPFQVNESREAAEEDVTPD
ncbi:inositol polyphosphate 5-phosphatase Ka isoform X2 [Cynoglossus semilaevis]|uniref:Inositol polyphosphate-5-phosphatase Ka n=1 Tax=Cynoglossus semilaevis TaxID=244447 RepID=A0A3P8V077_CYNSE|nr:inositol polyphosphate 5-phosphatase K-like isoform X2 [Cynoglossus semilaevis]